MTHATFENKRVLNSIDWFWLLTQLLVLPFPPLSLSRGRYCFASGVEFSGRSCAGINEINFKSMAESVSTGHEQLSFDSAFCQVQLLDSKILEVVSTRYLFLV